MEGIYQFAGTLIRIESLFDEVHTLCAGYRAEGEPEYSVKTTKEDIEFEKKKSAEEDTLEGKPIRLFPDSYLETLAVYRKIAVCLLEKNVLLFHGSAIALDGEVYLFTAKSGTGKSTHTRLWRKQFGSRAVMINDDKPLLRFFDDRIEVCGTPWDGKHHLSHNLSLPLKAICLLERAETNSIREIGLQEAMPMLYQQTYRPEDVPSLVKTLELVGKIGSLCRLYRLGCNTAPEAAIVSYEGMQN